MPCRAGQSGDRGAAGRVKWDGMKEHPVSYRKSRNERNIQTAYLRDAIQRCCCCIKKLNCYCKNQGVSCKRPLCRRAFLRHGGLFVFGCGLPHPSIAAHQGGHFFKIVQRERRSAQGLHGNAHELHGVVVCRHPVGAELSAAFAAVDDGPLTAFLKSLFIMRSGKVIFFAHFLLTCSVPCDIFITQCVRNFSLHFIVWYLFIHKKGTFL